MCVVHRRVGLVAALVWVCLHATSGAAGANESIARGKALLVEKCGRCHAVEAVGDSPLKGAPPMRDVERLRGVTTETAGL